MSDADHNLLECNKVEADRTDTEGTDMPELELKQIVESFYCMRCVTNY